MKTLQIKFDNIIHEDFILVDKVTREPIERFDIVYHYTSVIELMNDGFDMDGLEWVCVASLPMGLQMQISQAIESTK